MQSFDFHLPTRTIFGAGKFAELGTLAAEIGFRRTLLVTDKGLLSSGYVEAALEYLKDAGISAFTFHDFASNPDSRMIEAGRVVAAAHDLDSLIGLGGGSSLDMAKGINFVLTNGGRIQDYWGFGKATKPMLPMIGVPTTSGTGSEAQCYTLISDADTHVKMACGDPKAAFKIALLDPQLTISQPPGVTAAAGFDAIAHAVESYVTTKRNPISELYAREAWRLLEANFERVLLAPDDLAARGAMQLGAYYAGVAIENSMLGATHACANPLTAHYGTPHGEAIALMLPHLVRWNAPVVGKQYAELASLAKLSFTDNPAAALAARLESLIAAGGLPRGLQQAGVRREELATLAADAALQWTGKFNPRPFGATEALEVYECAF